MTNEEWDKLADTLKQSGKTLYVKDVDTDKMLYRIRYDEEYPGLIIYSTALKDIGARYYNVDMAWNNYNFDGINKDIEHKLTEDEAYITDKE